MPKNINCITIVITLEGIEKIQTEKWQQDSLKNIIIHQRWKKKGTNTVMASRFWLATYVIRLFDSRFHCFILVSLKYILARQILHLSPQNAPQCPTNW